MTPPTKRKDYRCLIKPFLVILVVVLIVGYSGLKLKDLLIGPQIIISSPSDGSTISKNMVNVKGKAERISQLYLNGKKIFTDEAGNFNEPYLLASGYNLLEIIAHDQFGRQITKKLQLTTI
ncbi:MAG: hypothetical protein WC385_03445 [Candidatus Paceibacterota bacterium]|jgi:hypothetical protein